MLLFVVLILKFSGDDFIIDVFHLMPKQQNFHERSNPFTEFGDTDFKQRFRYLFSMIFLKGLINSINISFSLSKKCLGLGH